VIVFGALAGGLRRVPASGGSPAPLTTLAHGEIAHDAPQFLSGGRFLYWVRGSEQNTGTYASTLDHPEQRIQLLTAPSQAVYAAGHLLWLRGSTLVAQRFDPDRLKLSGDPQPVTDPVGSPLTGRANSAAASGVLFYSSLSVNSRLTWFDRTGKALGTLGEPGELRTFRLSPDAQRAAVTRASGTSTDLWMVEIGRDIWSRLTFTGGYNAYPIWSPDARTVVFRSGTPGNLYRKDARGAGAEERVTESGNPQFTSDWSRDGRFLLYYELAPETQRDLWVLPVTADGKPEAGTKPRPYLRTRFNELQARFSPEPNPRWVAYQSDETGREEVYIQAFPEPRGKIPISTGGGRFPVWAPSGREVFYLAPDQKLMAVSVKLGAGSVDASAPRELFTVPWDQSLSPPYDVSPDGRFLVRATADTGSQPLQVIINWPALLKKRTATE
jgi:hypothetical protein